MKPLDIVILRDPRESIKKCSLTPLRDVEGVEFLRYRHDSVFEVGERILLDPEGEELTVADASLGFLLIDCAWRRVGTLSKTLRGTFHRRRLPVLKTAYPRKSTVFEDPSTGLASIEALYAGHQLLGRPAPELLADYRWRDEFLALNPELAPH